MIGINADKLYEYLEQVGECYPRYADNIVDNAVSNVINGIKTVIASLQQEQPEGLHFTPLNRLIQKIPSKNWNDTVNNYAKKLRDCLIKEGYLKDAGVLQGYISYMNGNNVPMATMDEQEQPEVDLEKEIEEHAENMPHGEFTHDSECREHEEWAKREFRYFYELGLNARKG